jgi:tRNA (guanine-N7-)-methyltransferase
MSDEHAPITPLPARRTIRSFVKRGGRITPAQQRALEQLWPRFGVDPGGRALDLDALFGRRAPRTLEIGFGNGEVLVALASAHPERDYLGIEVHGPGIGHCLLAAAAAELANLRLIRDDAVEVLKHSVPAAALDEVLILFADPWPKKRHHKRRLVQPEFIALLASRIAPAGHLRLATDWHPYADWMLAVLGESGEFRNLAPHGGFLPHASARPLTKFERRGARLGHSTYALEFERIAARPRR